MKINLFFLSFSLIVYLTTGQIIKRTPLRKLKENDPPSVDCLDTREQFDSKHWDSYPEKSVDFAQSDDDLPEEMQGKFVNASTIVYQEGYNNGANWNYHFHSSTWTSPDPSWIYIKYYAQLVSEENHVMSAIPALYPDDLDDPNNDPHQKFLRRGYNFEWVEQIIPVQLKRSYSFQLVFTNFVGGEYFLIDRLAVIQGYSLASFNDVRRLCNWPEEEGGDAFVCVKEGSFGDPLDNTKYHVCVPDNEGGFTDNQFTCPVTTVWCQKYERCETEQICYE